MTRDAALNLLSQHRRELAAFGLRRLAVFGSVARDSARAASDVDVLIDFEGCPTFDRFAELSFYLEDLFDCPVDLVTRASLREFMREAVEQEAIDVQGLSPFP